MLQKPLISDFSDGYGELNPDTQFNILTPSDSDAVLRALLRATRFVE
jgi:hypothetical protein